MTPTKKIIAERKLVTLFPRSTPDGYEMARKVNKKTDGTIKRYAWRTALPGFPPGRTHRRTQISEIQELYQQLLSTRTNYHRKTKSQLVTEESWRLCGEFLEGVQHILSSCSSMPLFFEVCRSLDLIPKLDHGTWMTNGSQSMSTNVKCRNQL